MAAAQEKARKRMKPNDAARTFTPQRLHSAVLQIAPQFKVTGSRTGAARVFCREILSKAETGVHRVGHYE